ncbi:hypothetical protein Hypma_008378 [Hypsizygus marmoreus]|uniref:Uncharacterized protein n=1 Tax=Hypsizygus marmoreus TaxID=39966 RepID=A0A369JYA3_HYPMA|nr:hypothetical protein Hypma_008378 [Hypsizygus marmoreus]
MSLIPRQPLFLSLFLVYHWRSISLPSKHISSSPPLSSPLLASIFSPSFPHSPYHIFHSLTLIPPGAYTHSSLPPHRFSSSLLPLKSPTQHTLDTSTHERTLHPPPPKPIPSSPRFPTSELHNAGNAIAICKDDVGRVRLKKTMAMSPSTMVFWGFTTAFSV